MNWGCSFLRQKFRNQDFDYAIDEYLYYCQSRRLRQKTMQSYEQTLRLFERWAKEREGIKTLTMYGLKRYGAISASFRSGANIPSMPVRIGRESVTQSGEGTTDSLSA
ncbi:MAG: site-specific integrase [Candidatus Onthomonas sp.]